MYTAHGMDIRLLLPPFFSFLLLLLIHFLLQSYLSASFAVLRSRFILCEIKMPFLTDSSLMKHIAYTLSIEYSVSLVSFLL